MKAVAVVVAGLVAMAVMVVWAGSAPITAGPAVQGCPACHGAAGKEPALDAVTKKITNHPATAAKTVTQCALCHSKGPVPAPFRTALHKIHLNSAKFASTYKGTCASCHNVDKATGTVTVYGLEK